MVTNNGNGTFDYNPNGAFDSLAVGASTTDTFLYTITDGNGGTSNAAVTITITGVNDDPTAVNDGPGVAIGQAACSDGRPQSSSAIACRTEP